MNILIPNWYPRYSEHIIQSFQERQYHVFLYEKKPRNFYYDPVSKKELLQIIREKEIDVLFTLQFFPILSNLCSKLDIPYICWCYNDPVNSLLLSESIFHSCNYIFHTDSQWVIRLQRLGMQQIAYLPWGCPGVHTKTAVSSPSDFFTDIACMDTTQPDAALYYKKLMNAADERTRGFLDGIFHAQRTIYGFNFMENILSEAILQTMQECFPFSVHKENIGTLEELYAFRILYPIITRQELNGVLALLNKQTDLKTTLYTAAPHTALSNITQKSCPPAEQTASCFQNSKINLLVTPREIQNGVPVQAMDIMGAGGFLLTNHQNDFPDLFEPGTDYVYYESEEDMLQKVTYYLAHDDERNAIAAHAHQKLQKEHIFSLRIQQMIDLLHLD